MHRRLRISSAGCCVVMLMGCRSVGTPPAIVALPATSAPEIPLRLASSLRIVGCDITFDDQRPDYERQYYPGTCEPRRWHDAMSFVPMEAFVPSIEDQLRQRVAASVKFATSETDHATITLTSFQFAFDQREDIQGEYQAKYVNWMDAKEREDDERQVRRDERTDRRMRDRMDRHESPGSSLAGELTMAAFTSLFIDLPRSLSRKQETQKRIVAEAQTLPTEITDGKQNGLNCQIHATLIFTDRQGADVERTIRIHRHAPLAPDGSLKDQTAVFIEAALEEFSSSI